jgi:hypothetical protein
VESAARLTRSASASMIWMDVVGSQELREQRGAPWGGQTWANLRLRSHGRVGEETLFETEGQPAGKAEYQDESVGQELHWSGKEKLAAVTGPSPLGVKAPLDGKALLGGEPFSGVEPVKEELRDAVMAEAKTLTRAYKPGLLGSGFPGTGLVVPAMEHAVDPPTAGQEHRARGILAWITGTRFAVVACVLIGTGTTLVSQE